MEFSGIPGLIEFGGFLRRRVNISRNLRLIDFSIREVFSLGLRDLIRLLTSIESFQSVSFT